MMKLVFYLSLLITPVFLQGQQNVELVARLAYDDKANDVWGYTAPDGTEYVLVGLRHGISIVDISTPAQPQEVFFIPGEESTWRDLRTWKHYAYVTTDQPGTKEGLVIMDLSGLPDDLPYQKFRPVLPGETDSLFTCHNVWVDELGFAYLAGCNTKTSNVIFLDLNDDPFNPSFAGFGANVVSHDTYARNNRFFSAEIFDGQFGIYDVSDKSNPVLLATQSTPFEFCHNIWLSDDGNTLFTTDERANAPTASYDISDLDNIRLLDEFRPASTLGTGVIPHNVHVLNDFLVISHYTDGCMIVDANQPDNLVQVGYYDTSTEFSEGFHGAWGAYPFFPSGHIAITDIENGLYILKPDYRRAGYLEGTITDESSGAPIPNATIVIQSPEANSEKSNLFGVYKTGLSAEGTFEVLFRAKGYFDKTETVTLHQAAITELNVQLTQLPPHSLFGRVTDQQTRLPVEGAPVLIENDDFQYSTTTDAQGRFSLPAILQGTYHLYAGKWGYMNLDWEDLSIMENKEIELSLAQGYDDPFNLDLGWEVDGTATSGIWERGIPLGTKFAGKNEIFNPFHDSPDDPGPRAYVTGNQGTGVFDDEVENGATILRSPIMQLRSLYNRPKLSYDLYFYNVYSNNFPNDTLTVWLTNGLHTIKLEHLDYETRLQDWRASTLFDLADLISITDSMQLIVTVTDRAETPNVVEGGLDNFRIQEGIPDEQFMLIDRNIKFNAYPNPFYQQFTLDYKISRRFETAEILVTDVLGRILVEIPVQEAIGRITFIPDWVASMYFVTARIDGRLTHSIRIARQY